MMKKVRLLHASGMLIIAVLLIFALQSCDDSISRPDNPDQGEGGTDPQTTQNSTDEFELIGWYMNTPDSTIFRIVSIRPDSSIRYTSVYAYKITGSTNEVAIVLDSVRLILGEDHYSVDSLIVEERRKLDDWNKDTEFFISPPEKLTKIAVVLVLDVSESLGNKFDDIKDMAKDFISSVFENSRFAMVGVVAFATDISVREISDDPAIVNAFIDSTSSGRFTKLYDAMLVGTEMLNAIPSWQVDELALVTFTDGINNYGVADSSMVKEALNNIKSYVVGFQGEENHINKKVLKYLADEGAFRVAYSMTDLQVIFDTFSNAITEIYQIYYQRNDQIVTWEDSLFIRFRFDVTD